MRILTRIRGWPAEQYMDKIVLLTSILKALERHGIAGDYIFLKAVVNFYPRTVYFVDYAEPISETIVLETSDLDEVSEKVMRAVRSILNRENTIARESYIRIYTAMRLLDVPVAGSLIIRLAGRDKREYGDIDFYLYSMKESSEGETLISDIISVALRNDKKLTARLNRLIWDLFKINHNIKMLAIMDPRYSINVDYGNMIVVSHNMPLSQAIQSHISLIRRYAKGRRKSKTPLELKVLRKLGAIYNLSKVVQDLTGNERRVRLVFNALRREYLSVGVYASAGSLIVISTGGMLEVAYPKIIGLLDELLSYFPDEPEYKKWVSEGLRKVEMKLRRHD